MAEALGFTLHLKALVAPMLAPHGFKQQGTRFVRSRNDITEEFAFQRSTHNIPGFHRFFLNIQFNGDQLPARTFGMIGRRGPAMGWAKKS